ncbi:glutamate--cysteine ligase [Insolitispirillum peregrinum]|uniref:glutamate--cysteine ligase n=1 Tax=Insolitispirillum peregrinum TaxID=80876 RepID=UPI00360BF600
MSAFSKPNATPIEGRASLLAYLESGCRPAADWRIGTEHETFAFDRATLAPIPYEGDHGVAAILSRMERFGWQPVREGANVIAMSRDDGASISLEPGGQLELSGAPVSTLHQTYDELDAYQQQVRTVTDELGIGLLGLGFHPTASRDAMPWMPKGRYRVMRDYMPRVGSMGLDMMLRTCTVQVNLDFDSEADMVAKMRVSGALQPLATALFANSPFHQGQPGGFVSQRMHVWEDVDTNRSGMPDFVFEDGFGFERWVDYLLDMPMYFVYRDGAYIDAAGQSFRDFMQGTLPAYPDQFPTLGDWADHMSTAFPDVRLKKYLEMRGADSGPWQRLPSLPALWVGLLYDRQALDAAGQVIADWTAADRAQLRHDAPRLGLKAMVRGRSLQDIGREVLAIAQAGLTRRNLRNAAGQDESLYLDPLHESIASGLTPADRLLQALQGPWNGDITRVFTDLGY